MLLLLWLVPLVLVNAQQVNIGPLFELLRPESVSRMAAIATELSSLAASNMRNNEKQIKEAEKEKDTEIPLEQDPRPSRLLGGAISDINNQGRDVFIRALAPLSDMSAASTQIAPIVPSTEQVTVPGIPNRPESAGLKIQPLDKSQQDHIEIVKASPRVNAAPIHEVSRLVQVPQTVPVPAEVRYSPTDPLGVPANSAAPIQAKNQPNAFVKLAEAFLGGGRQTETADGTSNIAKDVMSLGLRDFMPGANNNFGIPKGRGCLPFLSEFMQITYGKCQEVADERAFDAWGTQLRSAILEGKIDILAASQETCRRGAERQQCAALRNAISDCDIMRSLTISGQLQRAMKRCEDVGGLMDQNPLVVLGQLNQLIGGEMAQGFFNNFLTGKPTQ